MSDLGLPTYYLGIDVEQGKNDTTLCHSAYARKLLARSGMAYCQSCQTPMEERKKLSKNSTAGKVDATRYHCSVGSLPYLTHTQSDISFVMGYVSHFMEDLREVHLAVVKHLL